MIDFEIWLCVYLIKIYYPCNCSRHNILWIMEKEKDKDELKMVLSKWNSTTSPKESLSNTTSSSSSASAAAAPTEVSNFFFFGDFKINEEMKKESVD